MNPTKTIPLTLLSASLLALAGCGGGGGAPADTGNGGGNPITYTVACANGSTVTSTVSATDTSACPAAPASVPIVTSVPAANYTAGSQEKAAFDYLNNARSTCGFGLLRQDARLDTAAANHAAYILANNATHFETAGLIGFTGVTPTDRAAAAGYVGTATEGLLSSPGAATNDASVDAVRELLSAPYHFRSLMEGWRDVGFSLATRIGAYVLNINPGHLDTAAKQQPASGSALTYPCQGTTDTATAMAGEVPWPIPGRTAAIGQPILVQVAEGSTLVLSTYTITRTAGPGIDAGTAANGSTLNATSPLLKLDHSNDTHNRFTNRYNVAMLMPDKTMFPGSTYRVQVTGLVDGAAFSKDFTFVTGGLATYNACLVDPANTGFSGWQGANAYKIPYYCAQSAQNPDLSGPIVLYGTKF